METRYALIPILSLLLLPLTARSSIVLDQESAPSTFDILGQFNELPVAQTFTVGVPGHLTGAEVLVSRLESGGNLIAQIQTTDNGKPLPTTPTILAETFIPQTSLPSSNPGGSGPAFVPIDFSAANLAVTPGQVLALVLRRDRGGTTGQWGDAWVGSMTGLAPDYSGGGAFAFRPAELVFDLNGNSHMEPDRWITNPQIQDWGFRTFVSTTPEPTAGAAAFVLCCTVLLRRRR